MEITGACFDSPIQMAGAFVGGPVGLTCFLVILVTPRVLLNLLGVRKS